MDTANVPVLLPLLLLCKRQAVDKMCWDGWITFRCVRLEGRTLVCHYNITVGS